MCSMHGVLPICSFVFANAILSLSSYQPNLSELCLYLLFFLQYSKVPTTLSHRFFSTCITSILCLNFNFDQYSNSKKILFFVEFNYSGTRFRFLSTLFGCLPGFRCLRQHNCFNISSLENILGVGRNSSLPSCCLLLPYP